MVEGVQQNIQSPLTQDGRDTKALWHNLDNLCKGLEFIGCKREAKPTRRSTKEGMGGSYGLTAEPTLGFSYRAYLAKLLLNSQNLLTSDSLKKTFTQLTFSQNFTRLRFLHNFTHLRFLQNFYSLLNGIRQQQTAASAPIIEIQKSLAPHADFNIFAPKKLILTICDRKDISFIFLWQFFSSSFVYRKSWVFVTSCILKM